MESDQTEKDKYNVHMNVSYTEVLLVQLLILISVAAKGSSDLYTWDSWIEDPYH